MPCRAACRSFARFLLTAAVLALGFVRQAPAEPIEVEPPAEPWDAPAFTAAPAAMLQASAGEPPSEGGVDVLFAETRYEYDEAGRETYVQRLVYRVTGASAHESWSAIEQSWSPWHQERPRLRARVITPDGVEHGLDPATLAENAEAAEAPDMFEDGRVLRAPLPAVRPGAVVEQEVVVHESSPFFAGGTVRSHVLPMAVPVRLARLILEAPEATPLRWRSGLLDGVTPREELRGGRRRITFEARDLDALDEPEPGLPPEAPRFPYVAFSTGASWGEIAQRYSQIVDQAIHGADLRAFLRAAGGPAPSQLEAIDLYLRRMADEVRYTGIELGAGGLVPRTPAETLRRKFGDCKDKAVLLVAMLRASDIPAYVALLSSGEDEQDVEEALPGLGGFNHAIVFVPGSPPVWIDPTDPYARAGELPAEDRGRLALVASPSASGLVRTPEASAADNREVETREVYLAELGPARLVETTVYQGAMERDLRSWYAAEEPDAVRNSLAEYVKSEYGAEDLSDLKHSDPRDLSKPLELRLEAAEIQRGITETGDAAVAVFPANVLNRLPGVFTAESGEDEEPEPRRADYVFTRPLEVEMRYRVVPPPGFAPQKPLHAYRSRTWGTVTLTETYAEEGPGETGVLTAAVKLEVAQARLSPQQFTALRDGVREALDEKPVLLVFDQLGESHLAAGQVREALAEFQRLAAAAPRKALPRTRKARALLAGGLGEDALREAREAVRLEPGLAVAQRNLGWVLQHDALGRRFGKGWDRKGAIAAYRKAIELDAGDEIARGDLAIVLEHDAGGRRYSAAADLPAAIDEYRKLRQDLETESMDENLAVALLRAGRLEELRNLLGEIGESDSRRVLGLAATAALDGPDSAVRNAERDIQNGELRTQALANAAQNLILLRRYSEAAALLDRAGRLSSNAAALLSRVEMLRRVKKHEEIELPATLPASVVKRLLVEGAGEVEPRRLAALFSRDIEKEMLSNPDEAARQFTAGINAKRRQLDAEAVPLGIAMDLAIAVFRETVTGDDDTGYRVRLVNTLGQGPAELVVYVIREQGEYRISAIQNSSFRLGREALRQLDAGRLPAARQWLDWAHEDLAPQQAATADPLPAMPFLALWKRSAEAGAEEARCAAASLLAEDESTAAGALGLLRTCRENAPEAERAAVDLALAHALRSLGKLDELSAVARQLVAAAPGSEQAFLLAAGTLVRAHHGEEAQVLAEERLQRLPDDAAALRILAELDGRKGDFAGLERKLARLVETGRATAGDFNELAWSSLVRNQVDEQAIERAQRAATLSQYAGYAELHTLASLYAETGRTAEAYRILLQALEARDENQPGSSDWYVLGRLAEQYGLPDVARRYYQRVEAPLPPDDDLATSYALARRRLDALDRTAQAQRAGR